MPRPATPVSPPLAPVLAVRAALAIAGFTGVGYATLPNGLTPLDFAFWSQISALLVAVTAVAGIVVAAQARDGGAMPLWLASLRGATTSWTLVTLVIFALLLGADYSSPASALEHLVVPLLGTAEWLWVGPRRRLAWYWPLVWLVVPLLYLPVYVAASAVDGALYEFFDPARPTFGTWFVALLALFLGLGLLVRLRALPYGRGRLPLLAGQQPQQ